MLTQEDIDRMHYPEIGQRVIEKGSIWGLFKRYAPDVLLLYVVGLFVAYLYRNVWGLL